MVGMQVYSKDFVMLIEILKVYSCVQFVKSALQFSTSNQEQCMLCQIRSVFCYRLLFLYFLEKWLDRATMKIAEQLKVPAYVSGGLSVTES